MDFIKTKKKQMKNFNAAFMVTASILSVTAHAVIQETGVSLQTHPNQLVNLQYSGRIIVKYKNSAPENQANALSSASVERVARIAGSEVKYMRKLATGAHLIKADDYLTTDELAQLLNKIAADPEVEYAELDILHKPMATPNDPRYNEQWSYYEATGGLNLPTAWDTTSGAGVVVAVIDTGYRPHADLNANILPGYDMISDTAVSQDGNGRDMDAQDPGDWAPPGECDPASDSSWHGTHVAGTIAAVTNNGVGVAGVAYGAKVVPLRVLGRCGGYTSDIADAMIWAAGGSVSGVPANANPAKVLNLSLGGGGSCGTTQQNAINIARNLGASVVVAAGNENVNASNSTPANCSGVITVAAVGRNGGRASYSNYGAVVDVAAPGGSGSSGILSTLNTGTTIPGSDNYAYYQGTSMATPHVAGVVALLYSVNPSITPDQVENILKNTARSFPATCNQCGTGIVDATAAVAAAGGVVILPGELKNGVAVIGISGAANSEKTYTFSVPAGSSSVSFKLSGGSGDADLYVKYGSAPTTGNYDCRSYLNGNNETCEITPAQSGTYYVKVRGYSAFSNVSLIASYASTGGGSGSVISESNLSGTRSTWRHFTIDVAAGASALNAAISGGSGDADLYVRFGSQPTSTQYNCRPYQTGNNETCAIPNPQAGTWYVSIFAYSAFSGLKLEASGK